jgi:hypothetical protein
MGEISGSKFRYDAQLRTSSEFPGDILLDACVVDHGCDRTALLDLFLEGLDALRGFLLAVLV